MINIETEIQKMDLNWTNSSKRYNIFKDKPLNDIVKKIKPGHPKQHMEETNNW